ncbi:hypothetical protein SHELI_v1c04620 [Spiroplasma helicoides]|uniref:Uncharacterized protein n=1 Tax=Spiroplasma helicoides TaxID=216938 RepID=A0A1B3SKG2_9MOLU|nr:hypothetical protein SHELI_v1c04620 [Spiroplasma helicoides]
MNKKETKKSDYYEYSDDQLRELLEQIRGLDEDWF